MVTVERVLPWRREKRQTEDQIAALVEGFRGPDRERQIDVVSRAYRMADKAHASQRRKSGEPYIVHPLAVARIVADLGLDEVTIASALLHDAVEDTRIELDDIQRAFGNDVATIVDGVTKLDRVRFDSREAAQAASFRKMIVAMAKDIRVLIIKLCDRLHNLRTIAALPDWKQERTARETLDIYAPLAHRLGMQEIKMQLEDLSFAALHPKRYAEIEHMVARRAPERDFYLTQVLEDIRYRVVELNIEAEVAGRDKHLYSIYEKMVLKDKEFDEINDLVGIRVIVDTVRDCYAALGSIHATWKPVPGRFKDYVAMPKFNLYQSLHTTVIGPQGKAIEVQIRTREMHDRAEGGVASHYGYKDGNGDGKVDLPWLTRIIDWEKETSDPTEFLDNLKVDLDQEEVFVFTPQGQVTTLPAGSTPIDFAYAVHTEVGHRCVGAKVDGRLVPLSEPLHSGETVEIFTSKVEGAGPSRDWLKFVSSHRASSKIKQWFSRERREDAVREGKHELERALRREGMTMADLAKTSRAKRGKGAAGSLESIAQGMNYVDLESLHAAIGEGHISAEMAAARIVKELATAEAPPPERIVTPRAKPRRDPGSVGVRVEGFDDVFVRLSRCCTPVPGDGIMGFVTRGRGVSVHRTDCSNAESLATAQADRLIDVEWDMEGQADSFVVSLEVRAYDRIHLLADVYQSVSDQHINILSSASATADDRIAKLTFEFEIVDLAHLDWLIRSIRQVDGVYDVFRVVPGQNR
ncbi:MAG: bifunctional (p)ppGpp synthetase/guanosine-3',5'-bis(diphosphate) 3'-pyrophosphohydrolase [Acidimicrobiia bacterium]|nr:bifunctional (p)ppGpp synthetase/guanosine-3',5'-bis(diphosphate) 3'-pyrophosphohydrolase [Acidimicrobiia bacterium]